MCVETTNTNKYMRNCDDFNRKIPVEIETHVHNNVKQAVKRQVLDTRQHIIVRVCACVCCCAAVSKSVHSPVCVGERDREIVCLPVVCMSVRMYACVCVCSALLCLRLPVSL